MKNEEYNIQGWKAELSQPVGGDIFRRSDTAPFLSGPTPLLDFITRW